MSDPTEIPLRISWLANGRRAHGYLLLEEHALQLICLRDESETAGNIGKATAGQFGLIGGLISAGVSGVRELARAKELRELYGAQQQLPTSERLKRHPLSRSVARSEITGLQKGDHIVPTLQTATGPIPIQAEVPGVFPAIEAWCGQQQIPVQIVMRKKMNPKLFWGLILSPFALVVLYCVICVPFAISHRSQISAGMKTFEAFKKIAEPGFAAIGAPVDKSFVELCGPMLTQTPVEQQVGFVGELPPAAKMMIKNDYSNFPRFTAVEAPYSKWSDPQLRVESLESKWRGQGSFGTSFVSMLEHPFEWSRAASRTGLPRFTDAKLLIVGKVHNVNLDGTGGQAAMTARVLDFHSGAVKCEGDLSISFPPGGRGSSVGIDFLMSQGIPLGMHVLACGTKTTGVCKDVSYYAELTPTAAAASPTLAAAPRPAAKPSQAKPKSKKR